MVRVLGVVSVATFAVAFGCGSSEEPVLAPPGEASVMSFNIASGAGDRFRTAQSRLAQGALVADAGADVVALQEVDVDVDRSGNVDTAAAVAAAVAPGFGSCALDVAAPPHLRPDGTRLARCEAGAIVFGVGFRGDDPFAAASDGTPSGIMDADDSLGPTGVDRGRDAAYGNALIVRAPWRVEAAYTVALPIDPAGPVADAALLDRLRQGPAGDALAALAAHNEAIRRQRGIEPRSVLVVRVTKPGTTPLTVLTTHLESAGASEVRRAQLAALTAIARAEQRRADAHLVVAGDLNMPPSEAQPAMTEAGFVLAAPPAATVEIDQIWAGAGVVVETAARIPTGGASDHAEATSARLRAGRAP